MSIPPHDTHECSARGSFKETESSNIPLERCKHNCRLRRGAHIVQFATAVDEQRVTHVHKIAVEDCKRDEAREPEQHCKSVEAKNHKSGDKALEESGSEDEVEEDDEGPGSCKDHKVDLGRGVGIACNWERLAKWLHETSIKLTMAGEP